MEKSVEAQQEQFKPPDSEHGIRDAEVTELSPMSVSVPPEQSIPSAETEEQSEKEPVLEKTRVHTQAEHDPSSNSFHCNENPRAHSTVVESEEVETLKIEKTKEESKMDMTQSVPLVDQPSAAPLEEPTVKEADTSPSSFAELDILFCNIQNLLEGKPSGFQPLQFTTAEIANAKLERQLAERKEDKVAEIANAKLERQLAERKEEKVQLKNCLEDLAGRASTSRQALINAEQEMKLFMHKKEHAEEMIRDIDRLWESLKKKTCS